LVSEILSASQRLPLALGWVESMLADAIDVPGLGAVETDSHVALLKASERAREALVPVRNVAQLCKRRGRGRVRCVQVAARLATDDALDLFDAELLPAARASARASCANGLRAYLLFGE
jgi:hypothetical protein